MCVKLDNYQESLQFKYLNSIYMLAVCQLPFPALLNFCSVAVVLAVRISMFVSCMDVLWLMELISPISQPPPTLRRNPLDVPCLQVVDRCLFDVSFLWMCHSSFHQWYVTFPLNFEGFYRTFPWTANKTCYI